MLLYVTYFLCLQPGRKICTHLSGIFARNWCDKFCRWPFAEIIVVLRWVHGWVQEVAMGFVLTGLIINIIRGFSCWSRYWNKKSFNFFWFLATSRDLTWGKKWLINQYPTHFPISKNRIIFLRRTSTPWYISRVVGLISHHREGCPHHWYSFTHDAPLPLRKPKNPSPQGNLSIKLHLYFNDFCNKK